MKYIFSIVLAMAIFTAKAQTKDSIIVDSSIVEMPTLLLRDIMNDIQTQIDGKADVKKEEWQNIINAITRFTNYKHLTVSNKEQPKK